MDKNERQRQKPRFGGFTLIELSIVLVIIGLLVGGILVGRTLVASAEIRAQATQLDQYSAAVTTFRQKFNCLPGDCHNATDYFGTAWIGQWITLSRSGNGDGNGQVLDASQAAGPNIYPLLYLSGQSEPALLFAHLHLAGLATCCNPITVAQNGVLIGGMAASDALYPATKLGQGGFVLMNINGAHGWFLGMGSSVPATACGGGNPPDYLNLQAGGPCNNELGLLRPQQAKALDMKIDDGLPVTGRLKTAWLYGGDNRIRLLAYRSGQTCIAADSTYDTTHSVDVCNLFSVLP